MRALEDSVSGGGDAMKLRVRNGTRQEVEITIPPAWAQWVIAIASIATVALAILKWLR